MHSRPGPCSNSWPHSGKICFSSDCSLVLRTDRTVDEIQVQFPCLSERTQPLLQTMLQLAGSRLFRMCERLLHLQFHFPKIIHYSLSAFKFCGYGLLVRKRNCCQILQKTIKYSVLDNYKNNFRRWDQTRTQDRVLSSECQFRLVHSLYNMIFVDVPDAKTFIPALYEDSKLWVQLCRPGR